MIKQIFFIIIVAGLLLPSDLFAQHAENELEYRKFRVTLFPPLSTNGIDAPNYTARYSFNLLAGYHGGLQGFEIGPLNINRHYTRGVQLGVLNISGGEMSVFQFSGLGSITKNNATGIQVSGIGNLSGGSTTGIQVAGIFNAAGSNITGIQSAGLLNISGSGIQGIQSAGIGNIVRGNSQGVQVAGVFNAASDHVQGILVSGFGNLSGSSGQGILVSGAFNSMQNMQGVFVTGGLNFGNRFQGIQVAGVANIMERGQGVQVSLLNYARSFEGVPVGLISYYGDGRKNLDVWTNETGFTHFGLKLGTREVYNMLSVGYNPFISGRDVWSVGWSIGHYRTLKDAWNRSSLENYFVVRDFTIQNLQDGSWSNTLNNQISFRYLLGRDFTDSGFSLYAGPTFNLLVSREPANEDYVPYSLFKGGDDNLDRRFWVGLSAGIQIFRH